ncbi:winged helix-turn-helix transcriptional regulator [Phytomonospora endophytica]|uniref:DNA-binding HxlR family transcriptional regulator n=1 Tax=Phytomonospora endophytica TaxID=714109 RepID=A0A841FLX1_9ACTN|nr:helix-turn-helix domain-containing protein [Phytomonospora endophytica]MBB6038321.1 DNA-binding HxlR family transcriptional regulator [Phytomonospora endophytica]GIG64252.1 transcriptional regulator [Phytomonospora endophytica]
MSGTHSDVPSVVTAPLPDPVPRNEYEACPVTAAVRRVGDRWTLLVLSVLKGGPRRFNVLERSIEGISQRMLTRTLRSLESDGLVDRTVFATNPPSVEYALTAKGRGLLGALAGLAAWAMEHAEGE